jgi:signal-transduction protein with cAMP-binding, CBS, and nucleotidyltransferase domain
VRSKSLPTSIFCRRRLMDTIEQIAAIPLFQGLPRPQLEDLNAIVGENDFRRGEIIFSEGEEATGFYVVTAGRVKIIRLTCSFFSAATAIATAR